MCTWYYALVCQRTTDCDHGMNLATDSDECEPRGCMRLRWGLQIARSSHCWVLFQSASSSGSRWHPRARSISSSRVQQQGPASNHVSRVLSGVAQAEPRQCESNRVAYQTSNFDFRNRIDRAGFCRYPRRFARATQVRWAGSHRPACTMNQ